MATAALIGVLLAFPGAHPATASGRRQSAASVELVAQTPWVHPGEDLRIRFRVDQVPADGNVRLILHDPLGSRTDFVQTLDGELGDPRFSPPSHPLSELTRDNGTYEITLPTAGDSAPNLPTHGVYPVEISVTDAAGNEIANHLVTYLLLLPSTPDEFPPLNVAVVMEMGGPPGQLPDGTIQPDDATVGRVNDRIKALDQAQDVPLTVAPVPETLDSLAGWGAPGQSTPGQSTLDRLRATVGDRPVLGRPYVNLDLDSLSAAGLLSQTAPQIMAGAQVLRERLHEPVEQTWLTDAAVGPAGVDALRNLGVGRAIVPEAAVAGIDQLEGTVPVGPVTLTEDGPLAAVSDDTLTSRLLGREGEPAGELGTQRFLAELMTIWLTRPSIVDRGVVVRLPEDAAIDPLALGGALQGLNEGTAVKAIGIDDFFSLPPVGGEEPVTVDLATDGAPVDLRSIAAPLAAAQKTVSGLAATLEDQATIQSLHRSLLISLDSELAMAQRRAYIGRVGREVAAISDGINAPPDFKITLTARTGTIPLTIENRTHQTVSVDVLLQSNQLEFPEGAEVDNLTVPVGGRRIDLKVRTRTSGAFPLHITLTSPDRTVVFDRTTFTIRSTAVSGVGLVLSLGAGAFLLIWWARHWRTTRRSRRLIDGNAGGSGRSRRSRGGSRRPSGPGPGGPNGPGGPAGPGGPGVPDPTEVPDAPASPLAGLSSRSSTPPPPPPPPPPTPRTPPAPGWSRPWGTTVRRHDGR